MSQIDPNEFIITRKRKKYKFAHFANYDNCWEVEDWPDFQLEREARPVCLELGAGTGLFSLELARRHSDRFFVAVDVKADRLYVAAKRALEEGLDNVVFLRAHARQLPDLFKPASIDEFWLTFSDPYPKKRHAKHRLSHPNFLSIYQSLLSEQGKLRMKTDNHQLFDWSLERLVTAGWRLQELSFDLHESQLNDDYRIITSFESRFMAEGLPIYFLSATPKR